MSPAILTVDIFYRCKIAFPILRQTAEPEIQNSITLEVRSRFDSEDTKYFLYQIQEGCEAATYHLTQEESEAKIYLLKVREKSADTNSTSKTSNKLCSICSKTYKTASELRKHLFNEHNKLEAGFVCELCGKTFSDYRLFWKHKLTHSKSESYECDICKKMTKTKRQIRRHMKTHGIHEKGKYYCAICKESLTKEDYYKAHMRNHSEDLNYECSKCRKKFSSSVGLSIHKSTNSDCLRSCMECHQTFSFEEPVCVHLRNKKVLEQKAKYIPRGLREKTKSCPICGKLFLFNSEVKLHMTVSHTKEKKFVCEECGKTFKTQKCFQLHKRIHMNFRPYVCRFCDKRFRTLNHIKQHIRTHTGEKPYCCPVCKRGFAQSGDMKKHLLKIHDFRYDQMKYNPPGNPYATSNSLSDTYGNNDGNSTEPKEKADQEDETLTYGEAQVNLIRANIFKKRTVNTPFKRWVKCTHCLTMFSTKASLTRHLKRLNCKEESRELNSLSYLSLSEIKEAIYGSKYKKKPEEKNAVPVIHETAQSQNEMSSRPVSQSEDKGGSDAQLAGDQTEPDLLNCEYCDKTFTQKRTLNAHMMTHRKQQHLCPICGKQFSYKSSLVSHQSVHQKLPKSHVCGQCNAAFTTMRSLRRHYFTHYNYRDKEFICELCGKRFAYSMTLKNHKLSHSEERPHVCRICGTSFKRTSHLRTHEQGVHGLHESTTPKKYTCAICQKSMVKKESLEAHMKEHTGELNFQCNDCGKKFATNTGLNIHIAMGRCHPHMKSCSICLKDFGAEEPICEHLKAKNRKQTKVRSRPPEPRQSDKPSRKKFPVPRHMKERNYFCKVCGKHYIYPCELKTHFRLAHTDEKPFVCGRCGKAFKTKASLQMHEDVHNDLRPYKCNVCQKRFRKTEHVKLHMRTHTGEKPHVCDICGRGFAQKGDMKKHILKTHNRPAPQQNVPSMF